MTWRAALLFSVLLIADGCTIDIWPSAPVEKPGRPSRPVGPVTVYGYPGYQYAYRTHATDPDGDKLVYQFCINGVIFPADDIWSAYFPSGEDVVYYTDFAGYGYEASVQARVKDMQGNITPWSDSLRVQIRFFAPPDLPTIRPSLSAPPPHFGLSATSRGDRHDH